MGYFDNLDKREFRQGGFGSCQTLSYINELLQSESGRAHLESLISRNDEGGYVVSFPNKPPVTLAPDFIKQNPRLSDGQYGDPNGNVGVAALEAAALVVHQAEGTTVSASELFADNPSRLLPIAMQRTQGIAEKGYYYNMLEESEQGNAVMVLNTSPHPGGDTATFEATDANGNPVILYHSHAYSATVQNGLVVVENPHDTLTKLTFTPAQIENAFDSMFVSEMPGRSLEVDPRYAAVDLSAQALSQQSSISTADAAISLGQNPVLTAEENLAFHIKSAGYYHVTAVTHMEPSEAEGYQDTAAPKSLSELMPFSAHLGTDVPTAGDKYIDPIAANAAISLGLDPAQYGNSLVENEAAVSGLTAAATSPASGIPTFLNGIDLVTLNAISTCGSALSNSNAQMTCAAPEMPEGAMVQNGKAPEASMAQGRV